MMRIGIAGYGFMGRFHHTAYRTAQAGEVVAAFDVNPAVFLTRATEGNIGTAEADLAGVKTLSDFDAFLREVDVVDICAPTPFHLDLVRRALAARKHVLLEKPMALTLTECDEMLEAARAAGVTFMVAHCVRFWPGYDILLAAAGDGRYGALRSATFTRRGGCAFWSPWFLAETKSGGAVVDLLVHDFDLCRVIGGMPDEVQATGVREGLGAGTGVNSVTAALRFARPDAPALVGEGGWIPSEKFPFAMRYLAQFEEATLAFGSDQTPPLLLYRRKGEPEAVAVAAGDGYIAEVAYFLSVLGGTPERCPPEESRDAVAIALAARESIRTGRPVRPKRR